TKRSNWWRMSSKYELEQSEFVPALMSPRWMTRWMVGSALILSTSRGSSARLSGPYGKSPITAYVMWPLFASLSAEAVGLGPIVVVGSVLQDVAATVSAAQNSVVGVNPRFMSRRRLGFMGACRWP